MRERNGDRCGRYLRIQHDPEKDVEGQLQTTTPHSAQHLICPLDFFYVTLDTQRETEETYSRH
jgi:hypothetical protein